MPRFRIRKQTVWRAHSLLGLVAGLGLLVIGASGSLLMFSREIDGVLRPDVVTVEPGASRLPMDELVGRVASSFPGHRLLGWALFPRDPTASDRVWLKLPDEEPWLHATSILTREESSAVPPSRRSISRDGFSSCTTPSSRITPECSWLACSPEFSFC